MRLGSDLRCVTQHHVLPYDTHRALETVSERVRERAGESQHREEAKAPEAKAPEEEEEERKETRGRPRAESLLSSSSSNWLDDRKSESFRREIKRDDPHRLDLVSG